MTGILVAFEQGTVAGIAQGGALKFLGLPYAQSPAGPRRFLPPLEPSGWPGIRDASWYGPAAPQPPDLLREKLFGQAPLPTSEADGLTLNVFTPALDGVQRPVLVWIHGGAFVRGAGTDPMFDGARLAARQNIVVVTLNYRLGAFGFLHLGDLLGPDYARSGITGILDQIAALAWVQRHIASFGGDPGRVTICGQSAGAVSVATLLASPLARGLYHRAIIQSGSGGMAQTTEQAAAVTRRFLDVLGIAPAAAQLLLQTPEQEIVDAQTELEARLAADGQGVPVPFAPVIDGAVLPKLPLAAIDEGAAAGLPLLLGAMRDEANLFGFEVDFAPDRMAGFAAFGETLFRRPSLALAEAQQRHGRDVWFYDFRWPTPVHGGALGACHSLDLPFVFDGLNVPGVASFVGDAPPQALADFIGAHWGAFVRDGDPGPDWHRFTPEHRETMVLDAPHSRMESRAA